MVRLHMKTQFQMVAVMSEHVKNFFHNSKDLWKELPRPLYLLYKPREFGKMTLVLRLGEEIQQDTSIESFDGVNPLDIQSQKFPFVVIAVNIPRLKFRARMS